MTKVGFQGPADRVFWYNVGPRLFTFRAAVSLSGLWVAQGFPSACVWRLGLKVTRPFWQN